MDMKQYMGDLGVRAKAASRALAKLTSEKKNRILLAMADGLVSNAAELKAANAKDMDAGKAAGLSAALLDRLLLDDQRIGAMAKGLRDVAALNDPVGEVLLQRTRPNGLKIRKVRVPIGVIAIIYESRPNVTADSAGLCLKTGNAVILRGGKEALHSNQAIAEVMSRAGEKEGLPANAIQLVSTTDRDAIRILVQMEGVIDLVIPRGGEALIRAVAEQARVPVIKHYKGVCHVYVDADADLDMAERIVVNAKCQRPGVCNAMETLLVDAKIADQFVPRIVKTLQAKHVTLYGDDRTRQLAGSGIEPATEQNWQTEYLDLKMGIRVVQGVGEAIAHINQYGSSHSDSIVTRNQQAADKFVAEVDSSAVFVNASTRFNDGGEFGMGAEIGISTDKLHARGPMGLEELCSYKWVVHGSGQVRE
jgi:glutamate-5-semialdehyde dehydrogenase